MGLNEIVRSKAYKNFMSKLYGFGAAIVIIGALFKINHFPGAGIMLILGMGIEAVIFIFSAFEPIHEEVDWSLVYPELAGMEGESSHVVRSNSSNRGQILPQNSEPLTAKLDEMLSNAHITPEIFEKLSVGLQNLSQTAEKINAVGNIAETNEKYNEELNKVTSNLSNLNELYVSQVKASTLQMENLAKMQDNMNSVIENIHSSIEDAQNYKSEIAKLSQKVSTLNDMYNKMLLAMGGDRTNQ